MSIQFKRGTNATKPTSALAGEPIFCTDGEFYIGTGTGLKQISGVTQDIANKLTTPRTIGLSGGATGTATSFDGTANITIPVTGLDASKLSGTASVSTTGNAGTASKLATARNITVNGATTSFDGSSDVSITISNIDGGTW